MFVLPVDDEIELVLAEERHAAEVTQLLARNQQRLARWEPWARYPPTVASTQEYLRVSLQGFAAGTQAQTYIRLAGRLVGSVGLRIEAHGGAGEVGYWLDGGHEGRGIASRAVRALVAAGFRERALDRVQLLTAIDNARSRALAERLGFRFEGVMRGAQRFPDRRADMARYVVLASEWR